MSLRERLREDSEESSEDELVGFDQDVGMEVDVVGKGGYGGCHGCGVEGDGEFEGDHESCGCGEEDDRAGELVYFLMDLQATAMESFGGGVDACDGEFDPKLYVDLPLKGTLAVTVAAYNALPRGSTGSVAPGSCNTAWKLSFLGFSTSMLIDRSGGFMSMCLP